MTVTGTITYNDNNMPVSAIIDNKNDSIPDQRMNMEYTEKGLPYRYCIDSDGDNVYDDVIGYSYDDKGNIISQISEMGTQSITYDRSGENLVLTTVFDRDSDGVIDVSRVETRDEENDLTLSAVEYESAVSENFDSATYYEYDSDGDLLKSICYQKDEETPVEVNTYTWEEY